MSSPASWSCNRNSAVIPPNVRHRANRDITRRNSCSAPPPWRPGPMTKISTTEKVPPPQARPVIVGARLGPGGPGTGLGSGLGSGLGTAPDRDCPLCPRLADFRQSARAREPGWFNAPVPSFGDPDATLLIVGLA